MVVWLWGVYTWLCGCVGVYVRVVVWLCGGVYVRYARCMSTANQGSYLCGSVAIVRSEISHQIMNEEGRSRCQEVPSSPLAGA